MNRLRYVVGLLLIVLFAKEHCTAAGIELQMNVQLEGSTLSAGGQVCDASKKDSLKIQTLRFYYSNVELKNHGSIVWKEANSFHLYDLEDSSSYRTKLLIPDGLKYDAISFMLGIDSLTNVSGAMGGALDPTKGMYWTWQSGYINFKLEGTSANCPARKHEFVFHIGGYSGIDNSIQKIELSLIQGEKSIVNFSLDQFINAIDLHKQFQLMTPGPDAVKLARQAAGCFNTIKP